MAKTTYVTRDEIRAALLAAGVQEEEQPIDGRAYTFTTDASQAQTLFTQREHTPPKRFYLDHHMFILAK